MDGDNDEEKVRLTLVAENPSADVEIQRNKRELEFAELHALNAIRRLTVNLLRIIAGAGEPWDLLKNIDNSRTTCLNYLSSAKDAGQVSRPPTSELDLDDLFSFEQHEQELLTEEDWRRWAQPKSPWEDYLQEKLQLKLQLRRAVFRQVASILNSGEKREPHLKAHGGNLDEIIESFVTARTRLDKLEAAPKTARPDPQRQEIANQRIALLRQKKRQRQFEALPPHQVAGLRAVRDKDIRNVDGFTLDVLGRMTLLARPKGSKKKTDWYLTDDGKSALRLHDPD